VQALPATDLDHVINHTRGLWEEMRGARIFITGGTGFFGRWLMESLLLANDRLELGVVATVLTREPGVFARNTPRIATHPAVRLLQGDVRTFDFPFGDFRYVIHGATEPGRGGAHEAGKSVSPAVAPGIHRVLEFARQRNTGKLLFTSSGAVYGRQPPHVSHITEDYGGAPDAAGPKASYGEGKRVSELLCIDYAANFGIECKIARGFAFTGPGLPLDLNFAIGNFIRDVIAVRPVQVNGDGSPRRSYMYAADLAVWLWTILFRGTNCRPYNTGSENDLSVGDLARAVSDALNPAIPVRIASPAVRGKEPERYVPSTARARSELGLGEHFPLHEVIRRTAAWYGFAPLR